MIHICGSRVVISDIDPESEKIKKLVKTLAVYDDNASYPKIDWFACRLIKHKDKWNIIIPRNYPKSRLDANFKDHETQFDDPIVIPREIDIPCLYDDKESIQTDALRFLSGTGKYEKMAHYRQKVLALQTGKGKTYCTIKHVANLGTLAITIFHKEPLVKKWKDDIIKFTDIKEHEIAVVSGKESLDKIIKNKDKFRWVLGIHRTFSNLIDNDEDQSGSRKVNSFFKEMGFGVKIYDECHIEQKSMFLLDSVVDVEENIYLSATPKRTDRSADRIYSWMLPRAEMCFGNQDWLKREKYHDILYCKFDSNPDDEWLQEIHFTKQKGLNTTKYSEYMHTKTYHIYLNIIRRYIAGILHKKPTAMIVILIFLNKTARKLYTDLLKTWPDKVGIYNGDVEDIERDGQLEKQIIVSNAKMFREGNDTDVEVMINTIPMGGEVGLEQTIGRLRGGDNKKAVYIDITDVGFKKSKAQYLNRKKFVDANLAKQIAVKDLTDEEWIYVR